MTIPCAVCGAAFVERPGLAEKAVGVCWWCASRRTLMERYGRLYRALEEAVAAAGHPGACECGPCGTFRAAREVLAASREGGEWKKL